MITTVHYKVVNKLVQISFTHCGWPLRGRRFENVGPRKAFRIVDLANALVQDSPKDWKILPWIDGWTLVRTGTRRGRR